MAAERTAIPGSVVPRANGERRVRPADATQIVEATIVIRRPAAPNQNADPSGGQPLRSAKTREEIEKSLAADPADITAVTNFAYHYGLTVKEVSAVKRMVRVEGPAQNMNAAFGIELAYFEGPNGTFLSYDGPLTIEAEVSSIVTAVLGLSQAPVAKPRTRI